MPAGQGAAEVADELDRGNLQCVREIPELQGFVVFFQFLIGGFQLADLIFEAGDFLFVVEADERHIDEDVQAEQQKLEQQSGRAAGKEAAEQRRCDPGDVLCQYRDQAAGRTGKGQEKIQQRDGQERQEEDGVQDDGQTKEHDFTDIEAGGNQRELAESPGLGGVAEQQDGKEQREGAAAAAHEQIAVVERDADDMERRSTGCGRGFCCSRST